MAKLICTAGPNLGDEWELHLGVTTIGRKIGNQVVLHDAKVSRFHAVIKFQDDKYILEDLGSFNGTLIFGKRVTHIVVSLETPIQFGNTTLLLTRKSLHDVGIQHVETVGEDLFFKHKSKQAVMSDILHELSEVKEKEHPHKKGFLAKLVGALGRSPTSPPKKKGLG